MRWKKPILLNPEHAEWLNQFHTLLLERRWTNACHVLCMLHPFPHPEDELPSDWPALIFDVIRSVPEGQAQLARLYRQEMRRHAQKGVTICADPAYAQKILHLITEQRT